jgi:hypothetical protein
LGTSFLVRLFLFPIPVFIQYTLPFGFWSTHFLRDHVWYFASENLQILWLGLVGPTILLACVKARALLSPAIRGSLLGGVIIYCAIAFVYSGIIPRYATPSIALMMPAAGCLLAEARASSNLRAQLLMWLQQYALGGVGLLCVYLLLRG